MKALRCSSCGSLSPLIAELPLGTRFPLFCRAENETHEHEVVEAGEAGESGSTLDSDAIDPRPRLLHSDTQRIYRWNDLFE